MNLVSDSLRSSEVAERIRTGIDQGELKPRDRLPSERSLAEQFGVSRDTVRRALAQLTEEKLITAQRGSGSFVQAEPGQQISSVFGSARPLELMDVRFALEPHICRLAVLNAVKSEFDEMESLLLEMENSVNDAVRFADADTRFHTLLVATTANALLAWMTEQINSVRTQLHWTRMRQLTLEPTIIASYNSQHRAIFDAIRTRQPEEAAALMKIHLETARLSLTRASST
ncbi:MAG: FadR/GntR family transcriptional regulator [Rhodobacteraceae bacterium]|nr:FadR/GntR family transcriptional regulator [Paracoccaceae bacterium]